MNTLQPYKAIFSDIDGTFITSDYMVTEPTRNAIQDAIDQGLLFTLTSARSPFCIEPVLAKTGLSSCIAAFNGGLILDEHRNVLYEKGFSVSEASDIIDVIDASGLDILWSFYTADKWIAKDNTDPRVVNEEKIVEVNALQGTPKDLASDTMIYKVMCVGEAADLAQLEPVLRNHFPAYTIIHSATNYLEVTASGINKAAALRHLCDAKGIDSKDSIAFGDNYNDLDMLKAAGLGILMGNAPKELKNHGLPVTDDHDHDGIAKALNHLKQK